MSSVQCPQCARPVTANSDNFCTGCGSALPGFPEDAPGPAGLATGDPSFICPACRGPNPASRLLCQWCGALLEPTEVPPPAPLAPGAPWRWRAPLALLAIAAVSALAAVALGAALKSDGRPSAGAPSVPATGRGGPAPSPVKLSTRSISASASSELPPDGAVTYSIRNTLDGDRRTAWNSHSAVDGSGVGETLTYRFRRPVHLVRVDLVNGYAKTAELRAANARIRGVLLVADRRTVRASLSDTPARQRLDRDFGVTRTLTLRVTSIYPGARYTDLALTEIAFWAVPG